MIIPLDLTDEQNHIYKLLYKKSDFKTMIVKYTKEQLLLDSNPLFKLSIQKIRTILDHFVKENYLREIEKGSKGKPTTYEIVSIKELILEQQLFNRQSTAIQQLSNSNVIDVEPVTEVKQQQSNSNLTDNQQLINSPINEKDKDKDKDKIYIEQIEGIWNLYPVKKGKATAIKKIPKLIKEFTYEQIERTISRYNAEIKSKKTNIQYVKHGDTFFNGGYVDYLDKNYGGGQTGNNISAAEQELKDNGNYLDI